MSQSKTFTLKIDHILLQALPKEARRRHHPEFADAASSLIRSLLDEVGGLIEALRIGKEQVEVTWKPDRPEINPVQTAVRMLGQGRYLEAILLLELFLSAAPDDDTFLYNLGMAYSDIGELDRAIAHLSRLLELQPDDINGRVALGVALMRKGDQQAGLQALEQAAGQAPDNPWAQRNFGRSLFLLGRPADALSPLRKAVEIAPDDVLAWHGLAEALEATEAYDEADNAYRRVIEIDEYSRTAEMAQEGRSRIAGHIFRSVTPNMPRMDAVMYCLGAMEHFETLLPDQVQKIGFEIALLGAGGIDLNDPTPKYTLRSMPGNFSGLHLLSLEYVAFKQFAPAQDIGIDLSQEYQAALALHRDHP